MTFEELKNESIKIRGAIALEKIFSRRARRITKNILFILVPFLVLGSFSLVNSNIADMETLYGAMSLFLSLLILIFMLDTFFYSAYFRGLRHSLPELGSPGHAAHITPYEVLDIVAGTKKDDIDRGFLTSKYGMEILSRLELNWAEIKVYIKSPDASKTKDLILPTGEPVSLSSYAAAIYYSDEAFQKFLSSNAVTREEFIGASEWVERMIVRQKQHLRWWSRDSLGRIRGIGKDWAVGETYHLDQFGEYVIPRGLPVIHEKEVALLERTLAREKEANAILVGEESKEIFSVIDGLAQAIVDGSVLPQIEHKKIFVLNDSALFGMAKTKQEFISLVTKIFNEAVLAEHIILVMPNFPAFLTDVRAHGIEPLELLNPYLRSLGVQIVACSDARRFQTVIEPNADILNRFEKIVISGKESKAVVRILEEEVARLEVKNKLFFTYEAIVALTEAAERYFAEETLSDKAEDLLFELVTKMRSKKARLVTKEDVTELVKSKTGIPMGKVSDDEKEKLLKLESLLHQRIIGQDAAIVSISNALRRARSGIGNPNRPMGSFLFLGPTGVGKTETSKALAETFFGSESKIIRLDMSEYNSSGALNRLIGSFESDSPGTLVTLIRENPYGVLLLDEFEKADRNVLDLFLQIIDEGFFTDMNGKRVNARNLIMIATSNAGSDLMWKFAGEGKDVSAAKDEVVNYIIEKGIYKPELLNRFDGIIVFHPLRQEHLEGVLDKVLGQVQGRLKEKGIELSLTPEAREYLLARGYNQKFGARELNRVVQEGVEQIIAERLIMGTIGAGSHVTLSKEEVAKAI